MPAPGERFFVVQVNKYNALYELNLVNTWYHITESVSLWHAVSAGTQNNPLQFSFLFD